MSDQATGHDDTTASHSSHLFSPALSDKLAETIARGDQVSRGGPDPWADVVTNPGHVTGGKSKSKGYEAGA